MIRLTKNNFLSVCLWRMRQIKTRKKEWKFFEKHYSELEKQIKKETEIQ